MKPGNLLHQTSQSWVQTGQTRLIGLCLAAILLLPVSLSADESLAAVKKDNLVVPVTVSKSLTDSIPIGGKVAAKKSVILAAQLPGSIVNISGEEGDFFKKGSVLLQLDTKELMARRREAEAKWSSAYAAWQNAWVQRNQTLLSPGLTRNAPGGMGMPGMFDQIFTEPMTEMFGTRDFDVERSANIYAGTTRINQALDTMKQVNANIEQIDSKLLDSRSIAPFDGIIVVKHVEIGDTVQPGQPLLGFENVGQLQIVVEVPVKLAHNLKEGDRLSARLDVNSTMTGVEVANVFPKADPAQHTVTVKFNLPETIKVAAGTYAEVFIPDPSSQGDTAVIIVPETAITQRGGLPVIFVVDDENRVSIRLVRLGQKLSNNRRIIEYGLVAGNLVVDRPASNLISGTVLSENVLSGLPEADDAKGGTAQNVQSQ